MNTIIPYRVDSSPYDRLEVIQVLRGVAALLVVIAHAGDFIRSAQKSKPDIKSLIIDFGFFENFGAIGVDLFFIISGFVMTLSVRRLAGGRDAWCFLLNRFARIAPLYYLISILVFLLTLRAGRSLDENSIFNAIFFVPWLDAVAYSSPPLSLGWTLSFEFSFYLLVAVFIAAKLSGKMGILIFVMLGGVICGRLAHINSFIVNWWTNPIFIEFSFGMLAYIFHSTGLLKRFRIFFFSLCFFCGMYLLWQILHGFGTISEAEYTLDGSASLARALLWGLPVFFIFTALLLIDVSRNRNAFWVLALHLGNASYSLYLIHILALRASVPLLINYLNIPGDIVLLLGVVFACTVGWVVYAFVEIPITEMAKKIALKLSPKLP